MDKLKHSKTLRELNILVERTGDHLQNISAFQGVLREEDLRKIATELGKLGESMSKAAKRFERYLDSEGL
jgi:CRISPR/Cas system-associated endoribonuclease Cas2